MKTWDEMTPEEIYRATQRRSRERCSNDGFRAWGSPFWIVGDRSAWWTVYGPFGAATLPTRNGGR